MGNTGHTLSHLLKQTFIFKITLNESKDHNTKHAMRKPDFCICKNKGADQLCSNCCFRYIDSTFALLPKSKILRLYISSVVVHPGLF